MAAEIEGDFANYINGFRLNKLRAFPKWFIAGRKIAKMFEALAEDSDSGFLGYQPAIQGLRGGGSIQYWRSLEDLQRFAHDPDDMHVPAWKWVNENLAKGEVGSGPKSTSSTTATSKPSTATCPRRGREHHGTRAHGRPSTSPRYDGK